jgi:hypothetical protein
MEAREAAGCGSRFGDHSALRSVLPANERFVVSGGSLRERRTGCTVWIPVEAGLWMEDCSVSVPD